MKKIFIIIMSLIIQIAYVNADVEANIDGFESLNDKQNVFVGEFFKVGLDSVYIDALIYDPTVLEVEDAFLYTEYDNINTDECIIEDDLEGAVTFNCDVVFDYGEKLYVTFKAIDTNKEKSTEIFFYYDSDDYHGTEGLHINLLTPENQIVNPSRINYNPPKETIKKVEERLDDYYDSEYIKREYLYDEYKPEESNFEKKYEIEKVYDNKCNLKNGILKVSEYEFPILYVLIGLLSLILILLIIIVIIIIKNKKERKKKLQING